jgi:exonuclease VII large subunit
LPLKNQSSTQEYQKEYRKRNKEHLKNLIRDWQKANKEKLKQQRRVYYQNHPEFKEKQKERTNRKHHEIQQAIKKIILERGKCERCNFSDIRALIIHHPDGNKTKESHYKSYKEILDGKVKYEVICMNCHVIHHGTLHNTRNYDEFLHVLCLPTEN